MSTDDIPCGSIPPSLSLERYIDMWQLVSVQVRHEDGTPCTRALTSPIFRLRLAKEEYLHRGTQAGKRTMFSQSLLHPAMGAVIGFPSTTP